MKFLITSCSVVWPIVGRSQKILILNIYETLSRTYCIDVCHLNAGVYGYTFPPHEFLHHEKDTLVGNLHYQLMVKLNPDGCEYETLRSSLNESRTLYC